MGPVREGYFGYIRRKCSVESQGRREKKRQTQLENISYVGRRKKKKINSEVISMGI